MPIQLNYTNQDTSENISTSYWVATLAVINTLNNTIQFTISGYITKAAMQAGKQPFLTILETVTFGQLGVSGSNTLAQFQSSLYTWALANDGFFTDGIIA